MTKRRTKQILDRAAEVCRERGVKFTPQRARVLELVVEAGRAVTAYDILDQLGEDGSRPAPPTVYRALEFLLDNGLVHKLETLHAFVTCSHPEHPHSSQFFICGDCGDVAEIESEHVASSLASAEAAQGFKANRSVIEVLGTCSDCTEER